jgi:mitogen-activated protein kinase 1/3
VQSSVCFFSSAFQQIEILGTPAQDDVSDMCSDSAIDFLASIPLKQPSSWADLYPEASDEALDLLNRMLQVRHCHY